MRSTPVMLVFHATPSAGLDGTWTFEDPLLYVHYNICTGSHPTQLRNSRWRMLATRSRMAQGLEGKSADLD